MSREAISILSGKYKRFTFVHSVEVNIVTARAGTARGTSVIITFGEKDPEATLLYILHLMNRKLEMIVIIITDVYRSVKSLQNLVKFYEGLSNQ